MGILSRITNKVRFFSAADGSHSIDKSAALQATDATVINPNNPGNWSSIRTARVNHDPRYFTKQEADALWELRKLTTQGAKQSHRAYKHLGKIEQNDATVHAAHKGYLGKASDAELTKIRSNAKLARHLHTLRPQYARLGIGVDRTETNADNRIAQLKAKIQESR